MAIDIRKTLDSLPLCKTLTPAERDLLAGAFVPGTRKEGEWLVKENEAASSLFVVVEGKVEVTKASNGTEVVLARMGDGAVLGEMALITEDPRSASVRAVSACTLLELPRVRFQGLLRQDSIPAFKIVAQIADVLARRLALMTEKTLELSRKMDGSRKDDLQEFHRILQAWHF